MHIRQTFSEFFPPKPTLTEMDLPSLEGKTYLITGGAAGIGKELSRMLYSANATVYIAGRSLSNIEKATKEITENPSDGMHPSSGQILPLVLDLSDLPTIKPAVEKLEQQVTRIDAVFLNAGVMMPPPGSKTTQGFELQWGTNVVGHFLLQRLLIPLLRKSAKENGEVRIIWTASDAVNASPSPDGINWDDINGEKTNQGTWALYSQSKAGNTIVAAETARRYGTDGIIAVSLNPGHLKTELQRNMNKCVNSVVSATLMYEPRYGALTELFAGFSTEVNKSSNGGYLIPWGRIGKLSSQIVTGLENNSGDRLWKLLESETAQYS